MPSRAPLAWSAAGLLAAVALPWYGLQEGLLSGAWLAGLWSSEDDASGLADGSGMIGEQRHGKALLPKTFSWAGIFG